jgi:hypothetical protein
MSSIRCIDFNVAADVHFVKETVLTNDFAQTPIERTKFSAGFRVYDRGLHHCAGITYSIDGWATRHEKFAAFDPLKSDDNKEVWKVELVFPIAHEHPVTDRIEFVLWCEDYRCIDTVHKIYKTSPLHGGEPFVALFQTKD